MTHLLYMYILGYNNLVCLEPCSCIESTFEGRHPDKLPSVALITL